MKLEVKLIKKNFYLDVVFKNIDLKCYGVLGFLCCCLNN